MFTLYPFFSLTGYQDNLSETVDVLVIGKFGDICVIS